LVKITLNFTGISGLKQKRIKYIFGVEEVKIGNYALTSSQPIALKTFNAKN